MGYGDELMGSGIARGAAERGKRIAFGDGQSIMWRPQAYEIYRGNPNVADPTTDPTAPDLEWVAHYRGHRLYATKGMRNGKWLFNDFTPVAGEVSLTPTEFAHARAMGKWDVIIEPSIKPLAPNKQWPVDRYQKVADRLKAKGLRVAQFYGPNRLTGVPIIAPATFRHAMAVLRYTRLYIGPEGGLHHAAAAMRNYAVVIFGGFISPHVTGYPGHINLVGAPQFCGTLRACQHCRDAMDNITADEVVRATGSFLNVY